MQAARLHHPRAGIGEGIKQKPGSTARTSLQAIPVSLVQQRNHEDAAGTLATFRTSQTEERPQLQRADHPGIRSNRTKHNQKTVVARLPLLFGSTDGEGREVYNTPRRRNMMSMMAITISVWIQLPVRGSLGLMFRPKKPSSHSITRTIMMIQNRDMRFLLH